MAVGSYRMGQAMPAVTSLFGRESETQVLAELIDHLHGPRRLAGGERRTRRGQIGTAAGGQRARARSRDAGPDGHRRAMRGAAAIRRAAPASAASSRPDRRAGRTAARRDAGGVRPDWCRRSGSFPDGARRAGPAGRDRGASPGRRGPGGCSLARPFHLRGAGVRGTEAGVRADPAVRRDPRWLREPCQRRRAPGPASGAAASGGGCGAARQPRSRPPGCGARPVARRNSRESSCAGGIADCLPASRKPGARLPAWLPLTTRLERAFAARGVRSSRRDAHRAAGSRPQRQTTDH